MNRIWQVAMELACDFIAAGDDEAAEVFLDLAKSASDDEYTL